jgi:hypothetical protein
MPVGGPVDGKRGSLSFGQVLSAGRPFSCRSERGLHASEPEQPQARRGEG